MKYDRKGPRMAEDEAKLVTCMKQKTNCEIWQCPFWLALDKSSFTRPNADKGG